MLCLVPVTALLLCAFTDRSTDLLKAQVLLDRANFSPGEIDGRDGPNLQRAISGFQEARRLPVSGKLDDATWQALNADTGAVLVTYRITDADVAGPFAAVPKDMVAQSKLSALGFRNIEEALCEKFHASPALLKRINPNVAFKAGVEIQVPNVAGGGSVGQMASRLLVTKNGIVRAFDNDGAILAQYPCSSGSERDPLPIGTWKINGVARNPPFHYNPSLFWDADPSHTKAKIAPGPNNPVGVVWIDISKDHYGIHGTPEPAKVGHAQSHGCIRMTNWDAMDLAAKVKPGTEVVLAVSPPALQTLAAEPVGEPPVELGLPIAGLQLSDIQDTFDGARGGGARKHEATDILAPRGTPVVAADDGVVTKLFTSKPGGLTVYQFDSTTTYAYYYAHLDGYAPGLKEGMRLKKGDPVGYVGSTGNADPNTPHLHFAIFELGPEKHWWQGKPINPYPLLMRAVGK